MENPILIFSGFLFGSLLIFLGFVFLIFAISLFKKEEKGNLQPKISIIIPAFNEADNIKDCLNSVFESDYPQDKIEVLVVDDGSNDKTAEIAREFKKAKVITMKNAGKSAALNRGISEATHEYIVTIDADMILDKHCLDELLKPFSNSKIGATNANCKVKNNNSILCYYQNIEYHYNNLISNSFSKVFGQSMWFFGAVACYRRDVLKKIGLFKKVLAEDMYVSLEITKAGYNTKNVREAIGYTTVPASIKELYLQRYRWCIGGLQAVIKNRSIISRKSSPSTFFLAFTQFWGAAYSILALPTIAYMVMFWLPSNSSSLFSAGFYLFRWFSIFGIFYLIYKINTWGIAYYSLFGILSGLISTAMILASLKMFKDSLSLKNIFSIIFYFPYTIALNIIIAISILRPSTWRTTNLKEEAINDRP